MSDEDLNELRRQVRDAVPTPAISAAALAAARARLMDDIAGAEPDSVSAERASVFDADRRSPSSRRSAKIRSGFLVAAVTLAVIAVLLTTQALRGSEPVKPAANASPSATTLASATASPSATPDPTSSGLAAVVEAGAVAAAARPAITSGYTKTVAVSETLEVAGERELDQLPYPAGPGEPAWLSKEIRTSYLPADLRQISYSEYSYAEEIRSFGNREPAPQVPNGPSTEIRIPLEPGSVATAPFIYAAFPPVADFFDAAGQDPQAFIDRLREYDHASPYEPDWSDGEVARALIYLLALNAGPSEARGTMFRALGLLEGATASVGSAGTATVTITAPETLGFWQQSISFELSTGQVLQTTDSLNDGSGVAPREVPSRKITYQVELVQSVPL